MLSPPALGGGITGNFARRAYTEINNIYFQDSSQFDPRSAAGLALIIHEFTHIMQYREVRGFQAKYIKQFLESGDGEGNHYERRAYVNERNSEAFFNQNPCLLCPNG